MKILIAVVCAAGAIMATTSFANAQECRGGYRTLGNDVIVTCDSGPYYYQQEPDRYYREPIYVAPAPRIYVERRPYYYDDYAYDRYPYAYGAYPSYYGDRSYYRHRHYSDRRNCLPFQALSALIPGVAPPAC